MEGDRLEQLESPRKEIVEHLREKGWNVVVAGKHGVREKPGKKSKKEYVFEFTGEKLKERTSENSSTESTTEGDVSK